TPSFSFHVTLLPSAAMPPLPAVGISFARIGTSGRLPLTEIVASGSSITEVAAESFVPDETWTLRIVGACQKSRCSVPPPPRFVTGSPRRFAPVPVPAAVVAAGAAVPVVAEPVVVVPAAAVPAGALVAAAGAVVAAAGALVALPAGRVAAPPA